MPTVYFASFHRSDTTNHLGRIPLLTADEDGAVEQAKTILAKQFRAERVAGLKPTMVDVCEALGNDQFTILRRFYLLPDDRFREQPLEPPEKGKIHRTTS